MDGQPSPFEQILKGSVKLLHEDTIFEPRHEKTNTLVSDQVRHKLGCTGLEDGYRLEISDLEIRGILLSM